MPLLRRSRQAAPVTVAPGLPEAPDSFEDDAATEIAADLSLGADSDNRGPSVELLAGDQTAHHFQAELARGNWQEFHDFLDSTRDWDDRFFYVSRLSQIQQPQPSWLEEWVAARAASPLPLIFRGACGIHQAWRVRGGGLAKTVRKSAWPVFRTLLMDADTDLGNATELDTSDPTPHALRITAANGLTLGLAETGRRFSAATALHRWHYGAHHTMIQATARKWQGSHERMFEFANSIVAGAPDGSPAHALVPWAHVEKWLRLPQESAAGRQRQIRYFDDEIVRSEVRLAAGRSIDSPHYQVHKLTAADRNLFAFCYWLMRDFDSLLDQMELIGPLIQRFPWAYHLGDPVRAYDEAQTMALRKTRRRRRG